jgi:hypothetical protein
MEVYYRSKLNTLQLNALSHCANTRASALSDVPHKTPTGTSRAISQRELTFLQSESLQTHVTTIHRRVSRPLGHQNSTSAYSPSLTCHLLATIDCLHNSRDPQETRTGRSLLLSPNTSSLHELRRSTDLTVRCPRSTVRCQLSAVHCSLSTD